MWLRKILVAAAIAAPLAWSPGPVSAQEHGLDRAASTDGAAQANGVAGWTHKRTPKEEKDLPRGVAVRFAGQTLPAGMVRTRPGSALFAEPEPQSEPEPPAEEPCSTTIVFLDGAFYVQDCHGTLYPL